MTINPISNSFTYTYSLKRVPAAVAGGMGVVSND